MKLVLIGYRGTGKTSLAKLVAERLKLDLISMDDEIVKKLGRSIPAIIEEFGWEFFRNVEAEVAFDLKDKKNCFIDTGGGAILREKNALSLKKDAFVIWLKADITTIMKRIQNNNQRPSLTGRKSFVEEVEEVLKERTPLYKKYADYVIDTDNKELVELVDEVLGAINDNYRFSEK
ncbi:MAG: shikimate kinase [bacterium]